MVYTGADILPTLDNILELAVETVIAMTQR